MSKTYLVTGGAGFIGSNFIHYLMERHQDILVVNVDKLTYAGNLENLKAVMDDARYAFVQADICDREAMVRLFEQYTIDYVVNFAAESHVDRSITDPGVFVSTNVMGTLNLLDAAKSSWKTDSCRSPPTRCTAPWGLRGSSPRPPRWTPTAPTRQARHLPTSW
jgi:dTDP-glucose 4,6-dehydratase